MDRVAFEALPALREVIRNYGLRAEKSLGQNFLLDQNLTDKIVRVAGDLSNLHVFEIGPGPGGLTRSILRSEPGHLTAVEYDKRAITALNDLQNAAENKLTLLHADALRTDLTQCDPDLPRILIANLPYNIATNLLIQWLKQICQEGDSAYQHMTLMFQKEVAERIVAPPNTKAYGRLSVMSQWLCDVHIAFDVPSSAFVPPPKVTSSVVHFRPKNRPSNQPSFRQMETVTAAAFNQRRKMIRSSLKDYLSAIEQTGLDLTLRAEDLTVDNFLAISRKIYSGN